MGTARTRRTPVPPVEPTDDVAPLVEDPQFATGGLVPAAGVDQVLAVVAERAAETVLPTLAAEAEPALPTRFVVAFHEELGVHAVLARTALEDWEGWEAVEDLPDHEPPLLPARFAPPAD